MRTSTTFIAAAVVAGLAAALPAAQSRAAKTLDIYVMDVEGGNSTLFVAPSGESLLIDTGNGGAAAVRDAERIMAAVKDAGLRQIDHLITTHWHGDHFGGMSEVANRIPIREFIDHGANVQPAAAADEFLQKTYPALYAKAKHTVVKPGDRIVIAGLEWHIVASGGEVAKTSVPGAGKPNPYCAAFKPQEVDRTENAQSVGSHITYGRFRAVHLGDLTVNKEFDLMCPNNRLGTVDLWVVSHHGQPISNAQGAGPCDRAAGGHPEQRDAQGWTAGCDEDHLCGPPARGSLAAAFLAAERPGVHGPRHVHRQYGRRSTGRDADCGDGGATAGAGRPAAARAQRRRLLDQGLRAAGRLVHRHQRAERLQQELQSGEVK